MFAMVSIKEFPRGIAGVTAITKCSIGHPNGLSFGSTPPDGHGRANYINGPRVAGARSLPAKSDQVISNPEARTASERAPGPGLKPQAPSFKPQAY